MDPMQGFVVAITGAASGIALETAKLLWKRGASLSLADVNADGLKKVEEELRASGSSSQKVTTTLVDVTKRKDVDAWIAATAQQHGRLDAAANIAGTATRLVSLLDATDEDWDVALGINATGVFYCMRAQLSHMVEAGRGTIVNACSAAGLFGAPGLACYGASKAAVAHLTKTAAKEYGKMGIRVNAVAPGLTETPLKRRMEESIGGEIPVDGAALKRMAQPVEIASAIVYLLSDEASYQTGTVMPVDGGSSC